MNNLFMFFTLVLLSLIAFSIVFVPHQRYGRGEKHGKYAWFITVGENYVRVSPWIRDKEECL